MHINRFKNKQVFIRAGGKDLEVFNSDGVIFLLKMFKYFAERSSHMLWNSYLQLFLNPTDIRRRALSASIFVYNRWR